MLPGRPRTATRVARFSSQAGAIPREIPSSNTQMPRTRETPSSNHSSKGKLAASPTVWIRRRLAPRSRGAATNSSQREAVGAG
jgi:hypothetical protein